MKDKNLNKPKERKRKLKNRNLQEITESDYYLLCKLWTDLIYGQSNK